MLLLFYNLSTIISQHLCNGKGDFFDFNWVYCIICDMEICLILHNIRSIYNVGAILRTAEGLGVSRVICSGYTPWFEKPELLPHLASKLQHQIHKTALGAEETLEVEWSEDILARLEDLKKAGFLVVGLENNIDREIVSLDSLKGRLNRKVALVVGEEVEGIPPELYGLIEIFTEIPMQGQKESFNVSVATGIALYALNHDI